MEQAFGLLESFSASDLAGLPAAWLLVGLFFATFISEDAACIAAGALASAGEISLVFAIMSCFLGIVAGDFLLYGAGRVFGRRITRLGFARRFVSERSLCRATRWLERRGPGAIFASRFVTGLRLPTYIAAGFLKTDFRKFAMYFTLAAAIWTPIIVGSAAFSGGAIGGQIIVTAVAVFILIRIVMRLSSWRNRRIAFGKLKRIAKWEFWPMPVFYLPVVCCVILLAIRHRSLTSFTCVNPSIPAGGFVGESKDEIYALLGSANENLQYILRHCLIKADLSQAERRATALQFLASNDIAFPVVVKPDAGERGRGVRIAESESELLAALISIERDHIIQEFAPGDEVSVFYYRYPSADTGEIFSITQKVFPTVAGDGVSDLETLILRDKRAHCLAEKYFDENASKLAIIHDRGQEVSLIQIGTHSRGAVFRDGGHFKTLALEKAIDGICKRIYGFDFGRFDIRYSSIDEFRSGRGFKIIELNGVTSESTNIYDPRYSLIDAYRILFRQWQIAFEIGQRNMERGVGPTSAHGLFKLVLGSLRKPLQTHITLTG